MSQSIAAKAAQGAHQLVDEAERLFQQAIVRQGPEAPLTFPNTVYYLPLILGASAKAVESLGDLYPALQQARDLLATGQNTQAPSGAGQAALLAAEAIEALCSAEGQFDSRISDEQMRSWGVQVAEGRMTAIALVVGRAVNQKVAASLIRALQSNNILCLLSGTAASGSVWDQLQEGTPEAGSQNYVVPLGDDPSSAVHALGFAARCAMRLGGNKPGMWNDILKYCRTRTPGFVIALGELQEQDYAMAVGAAEFGFPLIIVGAQANTDESSPLAISFDSLAGKDEAEKAAQLVEKCMALRGVKPQLFNLGLSVAYSPAFEDETVCDTDLHVQFGGKGATAFEMVLKKEPDEITDGRIEVIGPEMPGPVQTAHLDLGIVVKVAGKRIRSEYESYLEHQIGPFVGYASGVEYTGRQDRMTMRISKAAVSSGFNLKSLGRIIYGRFHQQFGTSVEKVEVLLITDPAQHAEWLNTARAAYDERKKRMASITDDQVDVFYTCTHCRTFALNNVSIITPERVSPCGECDWFDARASFELDPSAGRRPLRPGKPIDLKKGIWEGTNQYAKAASRGRMDEVSLYSIMQNPMGACGDFECMVVLIPEANGVMVLAHEDTSRATPAGMTVDTFASLVAGEQIPGVVGIGKSYLLSPKFIAPEGGFKRVVWMSSRLKESMGEDLQAVATREGKPGLLDKIADERQVTTAKELVQWLKEHAHPALEMEKMF